MTLPPNPRVLVVVLEGPPQPKERPRVDPRSMRIYTPGKTEKWELEFRLKAVAAAMAIRWKPYPYDVELLVEVHLPDAKRRDIDNVAKSVADALNKLAYHDDAQIRRLVIERHLAPLRPRVVATVKPLGASYG